MIIFIFFQNFYTLMLKPVVRWALPFFLLKQCFALLKINNCCPQFAINVYSAQVFFIEKPDIMIPPPGIKRGGKGGDFINRALPHSVFLISWYPIGFKACYPVINFLLLEIERRHLSPIFSRVSWPVYFFIHLFHGFSPCIFFPR